jgi:integrase
MLPKILLDMKAADRPFVSYLEGFWKSDSPYMKECATLKKKPKRGKVRTVPYIDVVKKAFEEGRKIAIRPAPEAYVLESYKCPGKPMGEKFFKNSIKRELERISITIEEQKERNLTFHSLRHSFITLGRLDGISDLEIQAVAGHSSRRMMEYYSHPDKVIDIKAYREKIKNLYFDLLMV